MTKAALFAAVLLTLGAVAGPSLAWERSFVAPPDRAAWVVAPGYQGYSGYPWAGPPWASPEPAPTSGCYEFRQDIKGALRTVIVCR